MDVETIDRIICCGAFLDILALKGITRLEPGYSITDDGLEEALGICPPNRGDACLIRTGWVQLYENARAVLGEETGVPGVGKNAGKWLAAHGIRAAGANTIIFDII